MTSTERDECFTIREVDRYFKRRVEEQQTDLEAELYSDEPPGWFELTETEMEDLFVMKKVGARARSLTVEEKVELELFSSPPPRWEEMTPAEREVWFDTMRVD
jgi:hypothetical protein